MHLGNLNQDEGLKRVISVPALTANAVNLTVGAGIFAISFLMVILIVFFIYTAIQLVSQGVLGNELALHKEAPLAAVAEKVFGSYGMVLLVAATALSCFVLIAGDILVTSRLPYAAARDRLLPGYLAKLHPKYFTPYRSIIFYASIGFIMSLSGGFRQLAILSVRPYCLFM